METLTVGLVGWASGIVTVLLYAIASMARAPKTVAAKRPVGFRNN